MNFLTAQEQKVLFVVLMLLVVGMAVKTWSSAAMLEPSEEAAVNK
jgi:hypothetical protein